MKSLIVLILCLNHWFSLSASEDPQLLDLAKKRLRSKKVYLNSEDKREIGPSDIILVNTFKRILVDELLAIAPTERRKAIERLKKKGAQLLRLKQGDKIGRAHV